MHRKIIINQLVLLGIISVFELIYLVANAIFMKDCTDKVVEESVAGVITRVFQMTVMLLWRFVALTMCVFYLEHAKNYKPSELTMIEYDFQRAICIADDEIFSQEVSEYDSEDDSDSTDTEEAPPRV